MRPSRSNLIVRASSLLNRYARHNAGHESVLAPRPQPPEVNVDELVQGFPDRYRCLNTYAVVLNT
jgi:hypothetical protein